MAPTDRFRPRQRPKQDRSAQTRQWILEAAAHVFGETGYAAGTTNHIADRAGISIGSLYRYFPNKDAILRALMDEHVEAGTRLLAERLADGLPEKLDDIVRLFVRATIDNHRDAPRLHRVLFEEAPRSPDFLARLHEIEDFVVDLVTRLLADHPEVRIADCRLGARIVVVSVESLVHRLVASATPVDPRQLEDEMVLLLCGYLRGSALPARTVVAEAESHDLPTFDMVPRP